METEIEVKGSSPAEMMIVAAKGGYTHDQIMKMLDAQERYDAIQAKKAYNQAMSDFKTNPPHVTKDKQNSQYKSMYTTLGNLVNTVTPELSKHGLSASWDIKQNGTIEVSCKMTHRLGHSEVATASAPADTSGAKNAIQQIKSTITYLKAVTFESICGLASSDANLDDDGHNASTETIDEQQMVAIEEYLETLKAKIDKAKFLKFFKIESVSDMPKSRYQEAIKIFKDKETK